MKTYFILRDFFLESLNAQATGIKLQSLKIDNVETLTTDFFADTQGLPYQPPTDIYAFCSVNDTDLSVAPTLTAPVSFNPFAHDFQLKFTPNNGLPRGQAIGTLNGNNYGLGVLNFGVDLGVITAGDFIPYRGGFFIDIDYTKNLQIEFDVVTNNYNNQIYEQPLILRKYRIIWVRERCYREFSYFNVANNTSYQDPQMGFLSGSKQFPVLDFTNIDCGAEPIGCPTKERTLSFASYVRIPDPVDEGETIKECCFNATVLASLDSSDDDKNDYTGIFHQKQISNETCDFVLVNTTTADEFALSNSTYGIYKNFNTIPENPKLKTFILSWRRVLQVNGPGIYTILKRVNVSGIQYEEAAINYTLKNYTNRRADKTIRMDIRADGFMQRIGVEFKNSGFISTLRLGGFFGRRDPKFNEDNIVYGNYEKRQVSMIQENNYQMQTDPVPSCITKQVWDFFIFANDIFMTDYNFNNHLRDIIKLPVKLVESKEPSYSVTSTKARLNMTFTEKFGDNIKRNY